MEMEYVAQVVGNIKSQIGLRNLMCLGAHKFEVVFSNEEGTIRLSFSATGSKIRQAHTVLVTYQIGSDDYRIQVGKHRNFEWKEKLDVEGVYCDQLFPILDNLFG